MKTESVIELYSLEQRKQMGGVRKRATRVTEFGPRRLPSIREDVIMPSMLSGAFSGLFIFGVALIGIGWNHAIDLAGNWALGFGMSFLAFCGTGLATLIWQLDHYRNVQLVKRQWDLEPLPQRRGRIMTENLDQPGSYQLTRYAWEPGKFQMFARSLFNERGDWTGQVSLRRDHLQNFVTNYSENWKDVEADFRDRAWIVQDDDNKWSALGMREMKRRAFG